MSEDLNSGTVGGFGHMGPNDPYNDGASGSGGGSFSGGGNSGNHDSNTGTVPPYPTFGTVTDKTHINITATKDIGAVDISMCVTNLKNHEGFKNEMYRDTKGNVTVGIGHMLPNVAAALAMPFTRTHHLVHGHGDSNDVERVATHDEITSAFNNAKAPGVYNPSQVHLSDQAVVSDCVALVERDRVTLRSMYPDFDHFPNSVKTAAHDMIFNLGEGNLKSKFPRFNEAMRRQDWATAAVESHRTGISDARNKDTHDQLNNPHN